MPRPGGRVVATGYVIVATICAPRYVVAFLPQGAVYLSSSSLSVNGTVDWTSNAVYPNNSATEEGTDGGDTFPYSLFGWIYVNTIDRACHEVARHRGAGRDARLGAACGKRYFPLPKAIVFAYVETVSSVDVAPFSLRMEPDSLHYSSASIFFVSLYYILH